MTTATTRGGQPGNTNGKKPRIFSDALRKHAVQNPELVARAAAALWNLAADGDIAAAREISDRLEGKPTQTVAGDPDAPLVFEVLGSWLAPTIASRNAE